MLKKLILVAMLSALCTTTTLAQENVKLCTKVYRGSDHTWSQLHKVSGVYANGSELQKILKHGKFDPSSHYIYIPRKNKKGTVIPVGNSWTGASDGEFKDLHHSRKWMIRKGWKDCK